MYSPCEIYHIKIRGFTFVTELKTCNDLLLWHRKTGIILCHQSKKFEEHIKSSKWMGLMVAGEKQISSYTISLKNLKNTLKAVNDWV